MSRRVVVADFADERDLLSAVRAVRARGAEVIDVYAPYAVHALDHALGWRPSRLTWACALCGAGAALFALLFQFWTSAIDWPINVGGKPFNSLPAFVPVIFEAMVLGGSVGTVLAFFIVARLWPGRRAAPPSARVTDDRFRLIVAQTDVTYDLEAIAQSLVQERGEQVVEDVWPPEAVRTPTDDEAERGTTWLPTALGVVLVGMLLAFWLLPRNFSRPQLEYMPTMSRSVPWPSQGPDVTRLAEAFPVGTLARDCYPLDYEATEEDAQRAARELTNPFPADDPEVLDRGRDVFVNFCVACHGAGGAGDGPVPLRGYPPPPALTAESARVLADGELFHVISYGRRNMPAHRHQLSRADRWKVLQYIRSLQQAAATAAAEATAAAATAADATAADAAGQPAPESPAPESPAQPAPETPVQPAPEPPAPPTPEIVPPENPTMTPQDAPAEAPSADAGSL